MNRPRPITVRMLGMFLALLALSPLTAPFATVDISDLVGEPRPGGEAILQAKSAPHYPTTEADNCRRLPVPLTSFTTASVDVPGTATCLKIQLIPLRI